MAQNWDYAELSKAAKAAGGPEKYVEMLELVSKEAGKMEMLPWLGVAAVGASLLTAATIKVVDYFKSRKKNNETEIEKAKAETEIANVKKALEGSDVEAIKSATEKLTTVFYSITEQLYKQTSAGQQAQANPNDANAETNTENNNNEGNE